MPTHCPARESGTLIWRASRVLIPILLPPPVSTSIAAQQGLIEAGSVEQAGNPAARQSASLVRASASFVRDTLIVKATTEAEPDLTKFHVYIDSDLNVSTGFHPASAVAGLGGADFLCGGGFLYAWDGDQDHTAWSWRKIGPIKVTRGAQTELLIAIPLIPLNLHGGKGIHCSWRQSTTIGKVRTSSRATGSGGSSFTWETRRLYV